VASHNPFVALAWLVSGKTVGGTVLYPEGNRLDRTEALRLYTRGSAWFSGEAEQKGVIAVGQLADLAVLTADYFSIPETEIRDLESVFTILGGKPVYGVGDFVKLAPELPPPAPDWSPVLTYGGYGAPGYRKTAALGSPVNVCDASSSAEAHLASTGGFFGLGCDCFAF
jgi:hypothetical protein